MTIPMATSPTVVRQPSAPGPGIALGYDPSSVDPVVGASVDQVRTEIDEAFRDILTFHNREPDEVMRLISGHSGRMSELRMRIHRVENIRRHWQGIRQREIELVLDELQKQFQLASRLLTVRELDWRMESGAR